MGELRRTDARGGLYERLLQRLALALDEADSATRLHKQPPSELELRGLSPAELELIRAYLDRDLHWLRGWHAAAEELAIIEQAPLRQAKPIRASSKLEGKPRSLLKRRQKLFCALCGSAAHWQPGEGVHACLACGSQLFRAGIPR
ncbi:MAG: hypothetical protein ACRERX_22275 [Pseudomonas sp.]